MALLKMRRNMSLLVRHLRYAEYGEPKDVLSLVAEEIEEEPLDNQVLVEVLAAPINPSDINTIQGKYPIKPELPAVGGNECVGKIVSVGRCCEKLKRGQHVIPAAWGLGTWSTHIMCCEKDVMPISNKIGIPEAATISVNPCTAYRMLKDFVKLKKGDCVIQNGANSSVGQAVHQLCKARGIQSVGVVRQREKIKTLKKLLKCLGASHVLTDEEVKTTNIFEDCCFNRPILALNCVGGDSATDIARHLDHDGVMVTYGGMSRKPLTMSTATFIFKNISFYGFWLTRWTANECNVARREKMFEDLCEWMENGRLIAPLYEMVRFLDYEKIAEEILTLRGFAGQKYIFDMRVH